MKKYLSLVVCLLGIGLPAPAEAPFGLFQEAQQPAQTPAQIWYTILQERPFTLEIALPLTELDRRPQWETFLQQGFNNWFVQTAQYIRQSGRAAEFETILPILDKGITFGPGGFTEHVFVYDSIEGLRKACGSVKSRGFACSDAQGSAIYLPTQKAIEEASRELVKKGENAVTISMVDLITHEFGHQLGFADQYIEGIARQVDHIALGHHSSTTHVKQTLMSAGSHHGKFGCDDVDAMVNMIDWQAGASLGRKGKRWKSFCKDSNDWFMNGQLVKQPGHQILRDQQHAFEWYIDRGTGLELQAMDPWAGVDPMYFTTLKETVLARDNRGRVLRSQGAQGETIYYYYFQGLHRRAAFRQKWWKTRLAWVESVYQDRHSHENVHEIYFGSRLGISRLVWSKPSQIYYQEGVWDGKTSRTYFTLALACNPKSGKPVCEVTKNTFARPSSSSQKSKNSSWLGTIDYRATPAERKAASALAVKLLQRCFEKLPD